MKSNVLSGVLWIAVLVLAGIAVFVYLRPSSDVETPINPEPQGEVVEQSVSTPEITFSYTEHFGLAISPEQVLVSSYIPPCDPGFDYCLYYQGDAYEGTNFDSAGLSVTRRTDLNTEAACLSTPPEGYEVHEFVANRTDAYATSAFAPLGDAGAGHYASGAQYRLFFSDTCYSFEARIGASQFANYESGTIREFTDAQREEVRDALLNVLESVTLTDRQQEVGFPEVDF